MTQIVTSQSPMRSSIPQPASPTLSRLRSDLIVIAELIPPQTRVLDLGCGDGALLQYLVEQKHV